MNSQVIRPEEKKLLARLVEIMVALDLRFIQEKSEDGNLVYRLDPCVSSQGSDISLTLHSPIDVFVTYDGKRASDINVSRYAVRHLVAAEVCASFYEQLVRAHWYRLSRLMKGQFIVKRN